MRLPPVTAYTAVSPVRLVAPVEAPTRAGDWPTDTVTLSAAAQAHLDREDTPEEASVTERWEPARAPPDNVVALFAHREAHAGLQDPRPVDT